MKQMRQPEPFEVEDPLLMLEEFDLEFES